MIILFLLVLYSGAPLVLSHVVRDPAVQQEEEVIMYICPPQVAVHALLELPPKLAALPRPMGQVEHDHVLEHQVLEPTRT
jgi:hypothetical protein